MINNKIGQKTLMFLLNDYNQRLLTKGDIDVLTSNNEVNIIF